MNTFSNLYISCSVQIVSKLQEFVKHFVGLRNVICAVLNVGGEHGVLHYRKSIRLSVFKSGMQGDSFGCKERGIAGV